MNRVSRESHRAVSDSFEKEFLETPLEKQVALCSGYELVPWFRQYLPDRQPILEAGCGSGKWVAWFLKQGWTATGLDWSETLCATASEQIPGARFESGDMRAMPFTDGEFGSLIALGSIEHVPDGPDEALRDFHRVLRPGGVAIITVPYNGPVRKLGWGLRRPTFGLLARPWFRKMIGRPGATGRSLREARAQAATISEGRAVYRCVDEGWHFYEYQFDRPEMRTFLGRNGFEIIEERVRFTDEGIFQSFGRVAGRFDTKTGRVRFTLLGRLLRRMFSTSASGHMLCYVVRRAQV
ncbi:MAG: class I SAM-dependent methyltransferase [bacterium]|nr:class I SAM-dependent methyltransferase [bacterium]